jgi:hypothetical protein
VYTGTLGSDPDWPYGGSDGSGVRMGELAGMRMGAVTLAVMLSIGSVAFTPTEEVPFWGVGYGTLELIDAELLLSTSETTAETEPRVAAGVVYAAEVDPGPAVKVYPSVSPELSEGTGET